VGWERCAGQLMQISQYSARFSLLGTTYGGDRSTTFRLPDLQGRVSVSFGQGAGLAAYEQGQVGGSESVTLTADQLAPHAHPVAGSTQATTKSPVDAIPAFTAAGATYGTTQDAEMSASMIGPSTGGSGQPKRPPDL
jgi:microcystin-dependent protein